MKKESMNISELFIQASKILRDEFDRTSQVPHNLYKGLDREEIFKQFLNRHLPKRFSCGSGFIVDNTGNRSYQADVLIYDSLNSPVYYSSPNTLILDRDTVPIVIEIKSKLTKKLIIDCIPAAKKVKSLTQAINQFERIVLMGDSNKEVMRGNKVEIMYAIFAFSSSLSLKKIADLWTQHYKNTSFGCQIDSITVLDKGIVNIAAWHPNIGMPEGSLIPVSSLPPLREKGKRALSRIIYPKTNIKEGTVDINIGSSTFFPPGTKFFISFIELKELTLDWFFRMLLQYLSYL